MERRVRFVVDVCETSAGFAFATGMSALAVNIRCLRSAFTLHAAVGFAVPDRAGTVWMRALLRFSDDHGEFPLVLKCQAWPARFDFCRTFANNSSIALLKAGISEGCRLLIQFLSSTVC